MKFKFLADKIYYNFSENSKITNMYKIFTDVRGTFNLIQFINFPHNN